MFSIRLNDEETNLVKKYAELKRISVSELFRQSVMEKIEDELDLRIYEEAIAEYRKNPTTYSLAEVEKELGLK